MNELPYLLYVDDEVINLKLFELSFRSYYNILTAPSASEGMKILEKYPVPVIITDYKMAVMNGIEFVDNIKAQTPDKVCIMLTGYVHKLEQTNKGNLFCTITKPWDKKILLRNIQEAFAYYEQHNRAQ